MLKYFITLILFSTNLIGIKAQAFNVDSTYETNSTTQYEEIYLDNYRLVGSERAFFALSNYSENQFKWGLGINRDGQCIDDDSRFIDLEPLSNGGAAAIFQYDESCMPKSIVIRMCDSTGTDLLDFEIENDKYIGNGAIVDFDSLFHVYIQIPLTVDAHDFEIFNLTFEYDGTLIDSNSWTTDIPFLGGAFKRDPVKRYNDSLITTSGTSYYSSGITKNQLIIIDPDFGPNSNYRIIHEDSTNGFASFNIENDTINAIISKSGEINSNYMFGISRFSIDGEFALIDSNTLGSNYWHSDLIEMENYIIVSEYYTEYWSNYYMKFAVYDKQLNLIYREDAPHYGRFNKLSDSTFVFFTVNNYQVTNYHYKVNIDTIKSINPYLSNNTPLLTNKRTLVYPNPANDKFHLLIENDEISSVQLYSLTGTLVLKCTVQSQTDIDVSSLQSGIYLIVVSDINQKTTTSKVIVQ
tara:strand:+ start:819 stop:2216 length:1398 start_codon:yes stop_codon:yes gene_type:complete